MSLTNTPASVSQTVLGFLPALLTVVIFAFQVRFPPLSYPALGQLILIILCAVILLSSVRLISQKVCDVKPALYSRHAALLPGFLFVAWVLVRWLFDGAPADGAATVGTIFWAAAYLLITLLLIPVEAQTDTPQENSDTALPVFLRCWLYGLSLVGLGCGLYAVAQYGWLYKESYDALLSSIGTRPPDRSEAALLHHLNLRRVASFWGDPNSYAAFATLAFGASLEIFSLKSRQRIVWQTIAAVSMVAGIAGIFYTGSRGGVLDLVIVLGLYACLSFSKWKRTRASTLLTVSAILLAFLLMPSAPVNAQNTKTITSASLVADPVPPTSNQPGWVWRSDTIRERFYYLEVGAKMIRMAPLTGLGPGSINDYFGRLKNPNAREARHLHNWPVNIWAEFGAIGLGLILWFLGAVTVGIYRTHLWRRPVYRCFVILFVVLLFDGLLQTSWSQRELMCLFGAVCGILIAATYSPGVTPRSLKICRAVTAVVLSIALLILEVPFLTAASDKQIASDAMLANQPEAALRYWEKASHWAPHDAEPYQARAQMAIASGQLSVARLLLDHALKLNPHSAALHSESANLALMMNQPDRAENALQTALKLYPSHPQYNLQYAQFLQTQAKFSKAITFAERAREYSYEPEETAEIIAFLSRLYAQQSSQQK